MKQITTAQAKKLAYDTARLADETKYCQSDWIKANAHIIADIETKRANKTWYGEWPKGWKAEMLRAATVQAKQNLLSNFMRDHCMIMDGAIWLNDWHLIEKMAKEA